MTSESTWLILDRIGILVALPLAVVSVIASAYSAIKWWQHQRREKHLRTPIPIRLLSTETGQIRYVLPYHPPRRIISRSEVLGLLGMIPSAEAGKRYEWQCLHQPMFMEQLEEIHQGIRHALEIPLSEAEFSQIKISQ